MKIRKPHLVIGGIILSLVLILVISSQFFHQGQESACAPDQLCAVVTRNHYPARHWQWSGMFLLEGGWMPDPHFASSETMDLPEPARLLLDTPNAKFQIVDVNPAFHDYSSEVVLVIGTKDRSFAYSLPIPRGRVQAVLDTPDLPWARVIPWQGKLVMLEDFSGPAKGAFVIDLPLSNESNVRFVPVKSAEFQQIAQSLRALQGDASIKQQFCKTDNAYAVFWEKYVGSCGWTPEEYAANPAVHNHNYADFWEQKD